MFGVSFALTERIFYGTTIGNFSKYAKSVFLIPMVACQHVGDHVLSPVASLFGLDISFNLTSYVQNGFGIRLKDSKSAKNPKFWTAVNSWIAKSLG